MKPTLHTCQALRVFDVVIHRDNGAISRVAEGFAMCIHGGGLTDVGMSIVELWIAELPNDMRFVMRQMKVAPGEQKTRNSWVDPEGLTREIHVYSDPHGAHVRPSGRC